MTGLVRAMAAGFLVFAAMLGGCQAEDRMQATLGQPALVTAKPATAAMLGTADLGAGRRVLLSIVAFAPPADGKPVEIVVSAAARADGAYVEIGRVAITPPIAFGAGDVARKQNFSFAVPRDLASNQTLSLKVALSPVTGSGAGASLEVGGAAIH